LKKINKVHGIKYSSSEDGFGDVVLVVRVFVEAQKQRSEKPHICIELVKITV